MIENICLLLEILSIVVCLHCLYEKKFRFDIITTSFLVIHMIIMSSINYYNLPRVSTVIIYPVIAVYSGIEFGFQWRALIINNILYVVIIGALQLIVASCFGKVFNVSFLVDKELLVVNGIILLLLFLILPKFKIYRLSRYLQDKERILVVSLVLCVILTASSVINYKVVKSAEAYQYIPLFIGICLIFILAGQLGKYKLRSKEMETELKMHQLYENSFQTLIDEIRLRQHEFDNHISTLYSLHYTYHTYEELVKAQEKYGKTIIVENRHNKLLKAGNPLLIGFLYGKLIEIEKEGIEISYKISIDELKVGIPAYKLVEILGNLIKNAVEALKNSERYKALYVAVVEGEGAFQIEVRNRSDFIEYCEIEYFFKKGFSKKGEGRGLGLFNVKNICNEYSLKLLCENIEIEEKNWLAFTITNRKETI